MNVEALPLLGDNGQWPIPWSAILQYCNTTQCNAIESQIQLNLRHDAFQHDAFPSPCFLALRLQAPGLRLILICVFRTPYGLSRAF
jgi:hypothetical protein